MALIIENGTGVADANAYESAADVKSFLTARGYILSQSDTDVEALILRAMDTVNGLRYKGYKVDKAQSLPFPRYQVYDIDGELLDADAIPQTLKSAIAYLIFQLSEGSAINDERGLNIVREKVDVIETEYAAGAAEYNVTTLRDMPLVWSNLRPFLNNGFGGVIRG